MKRVLFFALILIGFWSVIGCNSHKNTNEHTHNGLDNHSHSTESTNAATTDYFGAYVLENKIYGTKTEVVIKDDKRIMTTNSLPDHKTGDFPNPGNPNTISAVQKTYEFPITPKYTGKAVWAREPGIALNGIKFEPGTAEVVYCETGENYRVEALQNLINLGLDFNHAHVQPTGVYHYHGTPTSVINEFDEGTDLVHIGFAHDGFPMYYSKSDKYKPSYKELEGDRTGEDCTYTTHRTIDVSVGGHHDGTFTSDFEYVEGSGDLDECNGITIDGQYMYLVTNDFPYISRCLMGEAPEEEHGEGRPGGGIRGNGQGERGNRNQGERKSADELIKLMDVDKDGKLSKSEVKGPLSEDFAKVDADSDGFITKEELEQIQKRSGQRPRGRRN